MVAKGVAERVGECLAIRRKLRDVVGDEGVGDLARFNAEMNAFVKDGIGSSGSYLMPTFGRKIEYCFSMQAHVASTVVVRGWREQPFFNPRPPRPL